MFFSATRRLRKLEERLDALESEQKVIALDWENTFRKLRKIMGRLHKEDAINNPAEPPATEQAAADAGNGTGGRLLNARQLQIQQQILRRRSGLP